MIQKLFGKWSGIASATLMLAVAVLSHFKPEVLSSDLAVNIMMILGIHGTASASAVVKK